MKQTCFSVSRIIAVPKQAEAGSPVSGFYREHGIISATLYKRRSKFGSMGVIQISWLKELENEHLRLAIE